MAQVIDTHRSRLLLAVLVLTHLVVISRQVEVHGTTLLQRSIFFVLSPLQRAVAASVRGVRGGWSSYLALRGVYLENERLRDRLRTLETAAQEREGRALESERLRELLGLRRVLPVETVVAEVIARDGSPWFRTVTVNKGTAEGIVLSAPVLSASGVVGRIIGLGPHAARVQLLQDGESGAGVLIERSRVTGIVEGRVGYGDQGSPDLTMKYVSGVADVALGDVVVTSGLDRMYPKGLVVGRISHLGPGAGLFREILVTPSARFEQMEEVLVVTSRLEPAEVTETLK